MPGPRAVIFDLGGTLWYWPGKYPVHDGEWLWDRSYHHLIRALPETVVPDRAGREAFGRAMVAAEREYRQHAKEGVSRTPADIVADGFGRLGLWPREEKLSAALEGYARAAGGLAEPFPDARGTLSRLRDDGYRTGILSNTWWAADWLDAELRDLGLAGLADEVLYTSDLPHSKPHPSAFHRAASRLGVEPKGCVMVGDDPRGDVAGALAVGMRSVWKRNDRPRHDLAGIEPTATVEGPAELPALLRSWRR